MEAPARVESPCSPSRLLVERTRYRVPRENHQFLLEPSPEIAAERIAQTHERPPGAGRQIWDRSLAAWREAGRQQCLDRAYCYTSRLDHAECGAARLTGPLIATGHQPELFHPGVWAKNVLTHQLAARTGGVGLNVIVDSDALKSRAVTLPGMNERGLALRRVVIDEWPTGIPWQELTVRNRQLFTSFADRVEQILPPLQGTSALPAFWKIVCEREAETGQLVTALAAGRRWLETQLGTQNLEVPLSHICQTEVWQQFLAGMLLDAERFQAAYNACLTEYRGLYNLRSESHPMPNLASEDGWRELPLWLWTSDNWTRRGLFVRQTGDQLQLTDRAGWEFTLSLPPNRDLTEVARQLAEALPAGVQIRPRALITTIFLRLFVADWFIHGIGGAKYDEISDALICRYFQVEPPVFQVATATEFLPLKHPSRRESAPLPELRQHLRYVRENPETVVKDDHIPDSAAVDTQSAVWQDLLEQKQELIAAQHGQPRSGLSRRERRARRPANRGRHEKFRQVREQLQQLVEPRLQQLETELQTRTAQQQQDLVLQHREYPFCCYPLASLAGLVDRLEAAI